MNKVEYDLHNLSKGAETIRNQVFSKACVSIRSKLWGNLMSDIYMHNNSPGMLSPMADVCSMLRASLMEELK